MTYYTLLFPAIHLGLGDSEELLASLSSVLGAVTGLITVYNFAFNGRRRRAVRLHQEMKRRPVNAHRWDT